MTLNNCFTKSINHVEMSIYNRILKSSKSKIKPETENLSCQIQVTNKCKLVAYQLGMTQSRRSLGEGQGGLVFLADPLGTLFPLGGTIYTTIYYLPPPDFLTFLRPCDKIISKYSTCSKNIPISNYQNKMSSRNIKVLRDEQIKMKKNENHSLRTVECKNQKSILENVEFHVQKY